MISAGLMYCRRLLNAWLGARALMDIRVTLYNKFTQLSLSYYDKRSTGSVMARITNDADNLWDFLADGLPWMLSNVLQLVGIGLVLFCMNWRLALFLLVPGPCIYGLTRWFIPRTRRRWHFVWHRSVRCTPRSTVPSTGCASSRRSRRKTAKQAGSMTEREGL